MCTIISTHIRAGTYTPKDTQQYPDFKLFHRSEQVVNCLTMQRSLANDGHLNSVCYWPQNFPKMLANFLMPIPLHMEVIRELSLHLWGKGRSYWSTSIYFSTHPLLSVRHLAMYDQSELNFEKSSPDVWPPLHSHIWPTGKDSAPYKSIKTMHRS